MITLEEYYSKYVVQRELFDVEKAFCKAYEEGKLIKRIRGRLRDRLIIVDLEKDIYNTTFKNDNI